MIHIGKKRWANHDRKVRSNVGNKFNSGTCWENHHHIIMMNRFIHSLNHKTLFNNMTRGKGII